MINSGIPGPEGQAGTPPPATPTLGQLKEALRVLEHTHTLFTSMKNQVVYACGEGHLLAADEGRQYLARIVRSLDEEHRAIRAGWPRLTAALEVARVVNAKAAAARGTVGGGAAAPPGRAAGAGGAAAAPAAAAVQGHCRSVLTALDSAVCEGLLAAVPGHRRAKRQRLDGDADVGSAAAAAAAAAAAGTTPSPPQPSVSTPSPPRPVAPPRAGAGAGGAAGGAGGALELLGVLLRLRALDCGRGIGGAGGGGGGSALGGMRIHALDDGGNVLALPSALLAALAAPAPATASGSSAAGAVVGGGGGDLPPIDGSLLAAGASRLAAATQVRMLLPGVYVANVLLEGPGRAAPLRVAVDSADRAFDLDPWATPASQVFRRLSALATRVLTYYTKRAALLPPLPPSATTPPSTAAAAAGAGAAAPSPASPPTAAPSAPPPSAPLSSEPSSPGGAALEELLLWLLTCRDLFSKRCAATGRLLAWDPSVQFPVPPIFRAFKLPRAELALRALDPARVAAFHMHVVPLEELGWEEDVQLQATTEWDPPAAAAAPAPGGAGAPAAPLAAGAGVGRGSGWVAG